jgi:hypothetical protein
MRVLKLRLARNVGVFDGTAQIHTHVALRIAGKRIELQLPNVDVAPASYRGERGVEVR